MAEEVEGEWKQFVFKMIQSSDHPKICKHMRDFMYYPSLKVVGYEKCMDDDHEIMFLAMLNDGNNLSFYAEDKETGKVAGVRVITVVKRGDPELQPVHNHPKSKAIGDFHAELSKEVDVFGKYDVSQYADLFGVCVDPEFQRKGLATEIYRRAVALLKARGFTLAKCGFSSPFSRKAGINNGYIELGRRLIREGLDQNGDLLNPDAGPDDFIDMGVFEIK